MYGGTKDKTKADHQREHRGSTVGYERKRHPNYRYQSHNHCNVDKHIKEDEDDAEIKNQISEKENIKVKVKENLKQIDDLKAQLNDTEKTQSESFRTDRNCSGGPYHL